MINLEGLDLLSEKLTGTTKKLACVNRLTMGAAGDMRVQSRRSHAAEGDTMRKIEPLPDRYRVSFRELGLKPNSSRTTK